jgi:hypothetical protein
VGIEIGIFPLTSAVSGVSSEGFMTIVHPTARAGATFPENQISNEKRDCREIREQDHMF